MNPGDSNAAVGAPAQVAKQSSSAANVTPFPVPRHDERACGARVYVPPGIYEMSCIGHFVHTYFRSARKLILRMRIVQPGEGFGEEVRRFHNVKTRRSSGWKVGYSSAAYFDYAALLGGRPPRTDRWPVLDYCRVIIRGRIETVTRNHIQREYRECIRWSCVTELLEVVQ